MPSKEFLFEFKAKSATFRVADTDPPLEEVSVVGKGKFKGKMLTSLFTTRITPTGKSRDRERGAGILYLESGGRAVYTISGSIGSTDKWREMAEGTMTFGKQCSGSLIGLKNSRASYVTLVNSKSESKTRVWKNRPLRPRD